jgi:hypothetical protein
MLIKRGWSSYHLKELGVRTVTFHEGEELRNMQLHPKDSGGSFF